MTITDNFLYGQVESERASETISKSFFSFFLGFGKKKKHFPWVWPKQFSLVLTRFFSI